MYKLIIGLGNPSSYNQTRHNVGKRFLDFLTSDWSYIAEGQTSSHNGILLFKPNTYMNIIGDQIQHALTRLDIKPEEIIIAHDDIEVILGKVKLKREGSAKGHNGIRSVIKSMGNDKFARLRIGVGRPNGGEVSDFVLSNFSLVETRILEDTVFPECLELLKNKK